MQQFASDNYAGVCPQAMQYLSKVNSGHEPSYGNDRWTREVCELFREIFAADCEVFFVFNGTAANSLSISTYCQPYHSVICSDVAHIETDECGAPEFFSHGSKILLGQSHNGKLAVNSIEELVKKRSDIHYPKPRVVSVTQTTELGTVYTVEQLREIGRVVQNCHLKLHMDGARFANALAALQVTPTHISKDIGVDVLCLGGSKNGLAMGDAIVFFNKHDAEEFGYKCKQAGQLASKMRYIAAQWLGILKDDVWIKNATHANNCASYLEQQLAQIQEVTILYPREANAVFVKMPEPVRQAMYQRGWEFYTFVGPGGARLMCAWDTQIEIIDKFVKDLKASVRS